ncbi:hypothetical protein GGR00_001312 [Aminobacter aganoensis]|uniref:Uncharacterized protein n=1 Tax=Aminobacter aganoensis TaxID=83264 RepID=A0A7X0F5L4_9HYPH|nr:hypothetical protein [Aminobacter aganoensis]
MATECIHLLRSDFDERTLLCEWPDQHPERFENAPMWLLKLVGSGLCVRPEVDCVKCPAFRPSSPSGDANG